jgi:hypothetical protein
MSSRGPSLPPRVIGEVIGTLTIRFLACSTKDTYARVQFWGESGFSFIVPLNNESVDGASHAIEYPLVGNILAINSYLTDASPLQVSFLRRTKGRDGSLPGPELVGGAYIRDICFNNLPHLDSAKCDKANSLKTTLLRRLKMMRPGSDTVIGEAIFELDFELFVDAVVAAPIVSSLKASLPQDSPNNSFWRMQQENPTVRIEPCVHVQNFTQQQLVSDDAMREQSDVLCSSSTAEKESLLEELLDLCNDDMTIPTIDSAVQTSVDPYDVWISRLVANANSPPAKEFPCLVSAGPNKSSALRKVGILKLDVDGMTLMAKVANKVKDKVLHLQYNSQAFTQDLRTDVNLVEIRLREQPREQCKTLAKPGRRLVKIKPIGTNNDVILHRIDHAKQIEVEFSDDESVRRWLDGTLEFSLFCHASNRTSHPKLPRVAMIAGKAKSAIPFSEVFLAKACFRLCDVILSETLSVTVKLDLVTTKDHFGGGAVDVNTVIGTLSINLGLYPKESPDCCVPRSETTESQGFGIGSKYVGASVNAPHVSSFESIPHPISVLLSYFAGMKINDCVTEPSVAVENASPRQVRGVENAECSDKDDLPLSNVCDQNGLLNSVTAPHDWLWVRVERISSSLFEVINERENGCLKLDMSCTNQFIQHGQVQPFSGDNLVHESLIVRSFDDSAVPMNSIWLWQFPLTTEYTLLDDNAVVLQLSQFHNTAGHASGSSERRLVGLAKIPFPLKPPGSSRIQLCNWLPDVVAQGSFDVLDPTTSTLIGNLEVAIAHGTLQQINGFSTAYRCILTIQRWWKRSRTDNKHKFKGGNNRQFLGPEIEPENPEKERPLNHEDCSQEFDTIHGAFIATLDRARRRESASSPDSLFEEWSQSQQSITASKSGVENAHGTLGSSTGDIPLRDDDSMDSLRSTKTDAFQTLHAVLDRCLLTREIGIAHSSVGGLTNTSTLERGTHGCECTGKEEWQMNPHLSSINSRTNLGHSTENERRSFINMSCLKPTKLENSFSKGQDDEIHPSTSIDPPEEIKQVSKRKAAIVTDCLSTAHDHPGNNKRHRSIENPNEIHFPCPPILVHDERELVVHYATSQAESSCAYENCVHADEDVDETMSYRSLTSVLGTLDRINSIFTCGEVLQSRCCTADDTANCLSEVAHHDVPDVNKMIDDDDFRCRHIERPDPGRHAEPPEENNFTLLTPRRNQKEPPNDAFMDSIQTCDRGSSPMSVQANRLVNASTSPPNNIDMDEAIGNGIGSTHSFGIGKEQQCNDAERHQSADNYDDVMAKGNDHESDEQPEQEKSAHTEIPTRRLDQQSQLATNRASRSEALNKNKSWQFMMHPRPCSALPYRLLGGESRGSLSPQLNCTDPPRRFCYLPRGQSRIRSSNIEVGASAKLLAEKMGALTFDTERLERIFQS